MDMTGYTKLFGSIVASTIWREPHQVRIVWITMLALANKAGIVEASIPGLADLARVTVPECEEALKALSSPDEYSRTKDHEGRRITEVDGGWAVLNHAKYRAKMGADERREYLTEKKREARARVNTVSTNVNNGQQPSSPSTHSEASPDAEAEPEEERARGPFAPTPKELKEQVRREIDEEKMEEEVNRKLMAGKLTRSSPPIDDSPGDPPGTAPSLDQWCKAAESFLIPRWYAEKHWHAYEAMGWRKGTTPLMWKKCLPIIKGYFENDGRPAQPPQRTANGAGYAEKPTPMFLTGAPKPRV